MGRVEAEAARLELVHRGAVVRAAVPLAVAALLEVGRLTVAWRRRDQDHSLAQAQRRLDGVGQPGRIGRLGRLTRRGFGRGRLAGRHAARRALEPVGRGGAFVGRLFGVPHDESIDHDLDGVALVLVELARLRQIHLLAVDTDAGEALAADLVEDPVALGLAILDHRAENEQPCSLGHLVDLVDDLLHALARDLTAACGAVRMADAGKQQAQVVVYLGHSSDGRSRIPAGSLLVDRDGRTQAVDLVDVGLLHLAQELTGVRGQTLDVPALALRVDRVEGEATLARARQTGDHDQPVARHGHRDVLEVVFAGSANDELFLRHRPFIVEQTGESEQVFVATGAREETMRRTAPSRAGCLRYQPCSQSRRSSQRA